MKKSDLGRAETAFLFGKENDKVIAEDGIEVKVWGLPQINYILKADNKARLIHLYDKRGTLVYTANLLHIYRRYYHRTISIIPVIEALKPLNITPSFDIREGTLYIETEEVKLPLMLLDTDTDIDLRKPNKEERELNDDETDHQDDDYDICIGYIELLQWLIDNNEYTLQEMIQNNVYAIFAMVCLREYSKDIDMSLTSIPTVSFSADDVYYSNKIILEKTIENNTKTTVIYDEKVETTRYIYNYPGLYWSKEDKSTWYKMLIEHGKFIYEIFHEYRFASKEQLIEKYVKPLEEHGKLSTIFGLPAKKLEWWEKEEMGDDVID